MIRSLLFYRTFSKKQFAYALAHFSDFPQIEDPYMQYACYRLGMYQTVANSPFYVGKNWRGGFARAVSLAACGRYDESEQQTNAWLDTAVDDELKANFADCLAPFHPRLAHRILQNVAAPASLRAALCLQVSQDELARKILMEHLSGQSENQNPENYLYYSNTAQSLSPVEQLKHLNRFLNANGVPALRLIDDSRPPGPINVRGKEEEAVVKGPLVSVLMTGYNSAERIASAIYSLLNQSYQNLELIVVDDESSDQTGAIVKAIAKEDRRVKYLCLPRNVGTYVAKNIGMQYARGEFVTCHDSDDWAHPLKISRQVSPLLQDKKLVFTASHWVRMQDDGIYYARPVHPLMRINPASPLFRRKLVLEHAGVWDSVRTGADSEFLARLKLVFGRKAMCRVVQPLTLGAHRPNSLMTAKETGYSKSMSPIRLAYWESWSHWHINELRSKRKPMLKSFRNPIRNFNAPKRILIPYADIETCIKYTKNYKP